MLRHWIPQEKLVWSGLSVNECSSAIKLLSQLLSQTQKPEEGYWSDIGSKWQSQHHVDWDGLSKNPNSFSFLSGNPKKINWYYLSFNTCNEAVALLKKNKDKIYWSYLCANRNPDILPLLFTAAVENPEKIDWGQLSSNPIAIPLLEQYPDKIDWERLSGNPNAIHLIKNNTRPIWHPFSDSNPCIDWVRLSSNPSNEAVELLKQNQHKIHWEELSKNINPMVISLLEQNQDKIKDWTYISANPNAISILEKNKDKIVWYGLSTNPNIQAIEWLRENPDKIHWYRFSQNTGIFINYSELTERIAPFKEELIQQALHPRRIIRIFELIGEDCDLELYI